MHLPRMFFLLTAAGFLAAAAPTGAPLLRVVVNSAQVTLGPGFAPPPGAAPFQPRMEAQFTLTGTLKGARLRFRFWRASSLALASLHKGRLVRAGATGFSPVEGDASPLPQSGHFHLTALTKGPWEGPQSLVVEVLMKGRLVARGTAPIVEKNLPSVLQREEMNP